MKKALGLILVMMMLLTSSVHGAEFFLEEMNEGHGAGMTDNGTAVYFGREIVTEDDGNSVVKIWQDLKGGSATPLQTRWQKSGSVMQRGQKAFFMFDFKLVREDEGQVSFVRRTDKEGYLLCEFMTGGESGDRNRTGFDLLNVNSVPGANPPRSILILPKVNTWYTYLFIYDEEFKSWELYRKERDDVGGVFVKLMGGSAPNNVTGHSEASIRLYNNKTVEYRIDNVHAWQGSYGRNGGFSIDEQSISELADVTEGTMTASVDVVSGNYDAYTNPSNGVTSLRKSQMQPLMVVYDKDGYMIDCVQPASVQTSIGRNTVSIDVDTSRFYDKIEGGYIGYYIFDNMTNVELVADPVELD